MQASTCGPEIRPFEPKPPPRNGADPICQNSQFIASVRAAGSVGRKAPNFSAR